MIKGIHFENMTVKLRLKIKRNPENWGNQYREVGRLQGGEGLLCFVQYRDSSGEREARGNAGDVQRSWGSNTFTPGKERKVCVE